MASALNETGIAGKPEEYFRPDYRSLYSSQWRLPSSASPCDFIAAAHRAGSTPNGVFSAKLHWPHFNHLVASLRTQPENVAASTADLIAGFFPKPRYLYLERRDTVRQAISWYRALATQEWWEHADADSHRSPGPLQPDYDKIAWLEQLLRAYERSWRQFFVDHSITPFMMSYEELSGAYDSQVLRVLEYIGIPVPHGFRVPDPLLKKQADAMSEQWAREYLAIKRRPDGDPPRAQRDSVGRPSLG